MRLWLTLPLLLCFSVAGRLAPAAHIPVKVVVVTMYQDEDGGGSAPGEFHLWVEGEHLDRVFPLLAGDAPERMNESGVLGMVTGVGTAKAAASVMALGLDPRFDLRHACWVIAGIGGGDPADVSLASAVWIRQVVDGDLAHEIDAREIPPDWPTGYVPLGRILPYQQPMTDKYDQVFTLDAALTEWAYGLTHAIPLADNDTLRERRSHFVQANARRPPFVTEGDELSASTYWHGAKLDAWANAWVRYYTGGKGNFVVSAMEETGTLQALAFLGRAGRVDASRVLVLRTISNYDQQPEGLSAAASLNAQQVGRYGAFLPSLESAYAAGHVVVDALVDGWARYRTRLPEVSHSGPARIAGRKVDPW